jgi:hypothetical protein
MSTGELLIPTCEAFPTGGGIVRASGALNLDPSAEHDPSAVQVDFNGSGLDLESLAPYLGSTKSVDFFRSQLGKLRLVGRMTGAHSSPTIRFNTQTADGSSQCLVLLTRDRAAARLRSPALEVSSSVLTEFPAYEAQKAVRTQEEAEMMREPRYTGGMVTAAAHRADVAPLLRALRGDVAAEPPEGSGIASAERAEISGSLRLRLHEFGAGQEMPFEGGDPAGAWPQGRRDFLGDIELKGARVNQLHVLSGVEGSVALTRGRLKVDAAGRGVQERLRVDLDVDSVAQAVTSGAVYAETLLATASGAGKPQRIESGVEVKGVEDAREQMPDNPRALSPQALSGHLSAGPNARLGLDLQRVSGVLRSSAPHMQDAGGLSGSSSAPHIQDAGDLSGSSSTPHTQGAGDLSGQSARSFEGSGGSVQLQMEHRETGRPLQNSARLKHGVDGNRGDQNGAIHGGERRDGASVFELQHGRMHVKAEANPVQRTVRFAACCPYRCVGFSRGLELTFPEISKAISPQMIRPDGSIFREAAIQCYTVGLLKVELPASYSRGELRQDKWPTGSFLTASR